MQGDTRTRQDALDLVLRLAKARCVDEDDAVRRVLSGDLIRSIFDLAWDHQWDRSVADFKRQVRPLVADAVRTVVDSDAD